MNVKELKRITELDGMEDATLPVLPMDTILDQLLILHEFAFRDGQFGRYVSMYLENPEDGNKFVVNTGASPIVYTLERFRTMGHSLPVLVQIQKSGRTYTFV